MTSTRPPLIRLPLDLPRWAVRWLLLGMGWLLVGMAASPVGVKVWNPGKPYHTSLLLLFVVPALWWLGRHARDFLQDDVLHDLRTFALFFLPYVMTERALGDR